MALAPEAPGLAPDQVRWFYTSAPADAPSGADSHCYCTQKVLRLSMYICGSMYIESARTLKQAKVFLGLGSNLEAVLVSSSHVICKYLSKLN